ncbi:MAG TPA: DUF362 domain-containing protein [Thermodesulfobacteriota bacterium]|nr:DUF362 domain-containing protein [Thermodesulfobacteriota bacterium]
MLSNNNKSKILVSKVAAKGDLKAAVDKAVALIGGFPKFVSPDDKVLIKANFNSPDRYPASSDPEFIRAVVTLLQESGVTEIALGASSGLAWQPTEKVLKKKKVFKLAEELAIKLINFDEGEWVSVPINGVHLKAVLLAKAALDSDKIIYLSNLKTHAFARFSMGLKFAVGLTEPFSRRMLHDERLEEKVVEINLAIKPDLIILDARKCLVTGGPARGRRKKAHLIFASSDLVALDVEALKILMSFKAKNRLDMPIWELPQIAFAKKLGLGAQSEEDYVVVTG